MTDIAMHKSPPQPPQAQSAVAVVILNWNGKADTLNCLKSVYAQTTLVDVIVVDNGSQDDSVEVIKQSYPQVCLLETGRNLGYAGGNNVGIRHALTVGATHVFVLNNDTVLAAGCVAALLADHAAHPEAAAFAPKAMDGNAPDCVHFAGGRLKRTGLPEHIGLGRKDQAAYNQPGSTEWITGCAIFAPRATFETVGFFDERFFLLFEDVDWSLRARQYGQSLRYVPAALLWHAGSASFGGKSNPRYQYYFVRNGLLWLERHQPLPKRLRLAGRLLKQAWRRSGLLAQSQQHRRALLKAAALGARDYAARRFGHGPYA